MFQGNNPIVCYATGSGDLRAASAATLWVPETVDTSGFVRGTSIASDGSGNTCIAYFNQTQLKLARRLSGVWTTEIVDRLPTPIAGAVGGYPSLRYDPNSDAFHISYYDVTNGDLKHAWGPASGPSAWTREVVDSDGRVGLWTSIIGPGPAGDEWVIAYYDSSLGALKVAVTQGTVPPTATTGRLHANAAAAVNLWTVSVIDSGNAGAYARMAGSYGHERIVYRDRANNRIKYAFGNAQLGSWQIETIVQTPPNPILPDGDPSLALSLALLGNAADSSAVTYYDPIAHDLRLATREGNEWRLAVLDSAGDVGSASGCTTKGVSHDSLFVAYRNTEGGALKFLSEPQPFLREIDSATPICDRMASVNGTVYAAVESGGTLYVGGSFAEAGSATGSAAPIDAASGLLQGFPKVTGVVNAVAPDGAGGWYVGGSFAHVAGVARSNLARLASDFSLTSWDPSPNGVVRALAVSGGAVYAGGDFTIIGGQPRNRIAKLDPTTGAATSWNPDANNAVRALLVTGGALYAGGDFTSLGGPTRNHIAVLDTATGLATACDPGANGNVHALAASGSLIYVGGEFTTIGGQLRNRAAAIDGGTCGITTWNPDANGTVRAVAVGASSVYLGGDFTTISGQIRSHVSGVTPAGGLNSFKPVLNGAVHALAVSGSVVYAGGDFTTIGATTRNRIAAFDASNGAPASWNPNANNRVHALAVNGTTVFAGGSFTGLAWSTRNNIAAIDVASGALKAWDPNATGASTGEVRALLVSGGTVYAGGFFNNIGGQARNRIAALDATTGLATAWNPNASAPVLALTLASSGSLLYVGGNFASIGGLTRPLIAAVDVGTGLADAWNAHANGPGSVWSIAVDGGTVYAGGDFTGMGGFACKLAAVSASSGSVLWSSQQFGAVMHALVVSAGKLYVGGEFSILRGAARAGLGALIAATGDTTAWNPKPDNVGIMALAMNGGHLYVGGDFSEIAGQLRNGAAAVDTATGYATEFNPDPAGDVAYALASSGPGIYLGGDFTAVAGLPHAGIACTEVPEMVSVPIDRPARDLEFGVRLFPNPTSSRARVEFTLSKAAHVRVLVFDVQGRIVSRLLDQRRPAGRHEVVWDGRGAQGAAPAGVYFVRTDVFGRSTTRHVVLLR